MQFREKKFTVSLFMTHTRQFSEPCTHPVGTFTIPLDQQNYHMVHVKLICPSPRADLQGDAVDIEIRSIVQPIARTISRRDAAMSRNGAISTL
jgi:hypothetical protein